MKIDKYYVLGFACWLLSLVFAGLVINQFVNNTTLRLVIGMIYNIITWVCVMKWVSIKQRKNWRNL